MKSHTEAIDTILSGKVHSYSVEFGPASGAIETTDDGKTVAGSTSLGKSYVIKGSKPRSSVEGSKGSTNMILATYMKYKPAKNIIEYVAI